MKVSSFLTYDKKNWLKAGEMSVYTGYFTLLDSDKKRIFVVISGCAGSEVTFSPAISSSRLSVMALITAPIAITTIRYPGEEFQALEALGQARLLYNKKRVSGAAQ